MRVRLLAAALAFLSCGSSGIFAQSLGDVAKKEQERRKTTKTAGKVYTNKDLGPGATKPATPTPAPAPGSSTTAGPGGSETPPATPDNAEDQDPRKTEAYWRDRIETVRAEIERSELFLEALQSRVNALTTDFVNRDDPAQRAVIGSDRQKALAAMDRVRQEIDALKKQVADIEEEARQAGVPPGWLR